MNQKIAPEIKVMAFDFFDTLVHRTVHPEVNLFKWAKEIALELNFALDPKKIYDLRKQSEIELKRNVEESTYDNLISLLFKKITTKFKVDLSEKEFIKVSFDKELEIELNSIYLNEKIVPYIHQAKKYGLKLVVISDFYFGKELFVRALDKIKISEYFSEIYVSSEFGVRKSTGNLFKRVMDIENINSKEIMMIGDNVNSDYKVPSSLGILCEHIEFNETHNIITSKRNYYQEQKKLFEGNNSLEPFNGYSFSMLIFVERLYRKLIKDKVNRVLFCSREGQFLKKIFDLYQEIEDVPKKINTEYFYTSRKATLVAALVDIKNENFQSVFRQYDQLLLTDFLSSIAFTAVEKERTYKHAHLNPKSLIKPYGVNSELKKLTRDEYFISKYNEKRNRQNELLKKYIRQLSDNDNVITIVDVGWKGTMQNNLNKIFEHTNIQIKGYYFGLLLPDRENSKDKFGINFSNDQHKTKYFRVLSKNYMVYERVFVADHGAVNGYEEDENGCVVPNLSSDENELQLYKYVQPFQDQLLIFFKKVLCINSVSILSLDDVEYINTKFTLQQGCLMFPKFWKVEESQRSKTRENFGDISRTLRSSKKEIIKQKMKKRKFGFVDYAYKIPQSLLKNNGLNFLSAAYCRVIYGTNLMILKLAHLWRS